MDLHNIWTNCLRDAESRHRSVVPSWTTSVIVCPLCDRQIDESAWKHHARQLHRVHMARDSASEDEWLTKTLAGARRFGGEPGPAPPDKQPPAVSDESTVGRSGIGGGARVDDNQLQLHHGAPLSPAPPGPSSTTRQHDARRDDFYRGPVARGTLWREGGPSAGPVSRQHQQQQVGILAGGSNTKSSGSGRHRQRHNRPGPTSSASLPGPSNAVRPMEREPRIRPISSEQLVIEVKGIYAGLVMVESKCIEVDSAQSSQSAESGQKLNNEQWQALIALHRTLLHEHHDFFLASQHPMASPPLKRLADKYAMPARMWRHGIHSFLELLRHRLPGSLEHMLTFIYLAYSMIALLYETVPAFEETWIECLGDLGRYRMAIEDADMRDREVWTAVSRDWYGKASDMSPTTGRLYHHLAILARPSPIPQLFYYAKSLCVPIAFQSARTSIMTLFEPLLAVSAADQQSPARHVEAMFARIHGIVYTGRHPVSLPDELTEFCVELYSYIRHKPGLFPDKGYWIAVSNCCSIVGYGGEDNPIARALKPNPLENELGADQTEAGRPNLMLQQASLITYRITCTLLRRIGDPVSLTYLHALAVFVWYLSTMPAVFDHVAEAVPWRLFALNLNFFLDAERESRHETVRFPVPEKGGIRPLPEDWAMRGLAWADEYLPDRWLSSDPNLDEGDKYIEQLSMKSERRERILWLGARLAERDCTWLRYSREQREFTVPDEYGHEEELELAVEGQGPGSTDSDSA